MQIYSFRKFKIFHWKHGSTTQVMPGQIPARVTEKYNCGKKKIWQRLVITKSCVSIRYSLFIQLYELHCLVLRHLNIIWYVHGQFLSIIVYLDQHPVLSYLNEYSLICCVSDQAFKEVLYVFVNIFLRLFLSSLFCEELWQCQDVCDCHERTSSLHSPKT